MLKLGVLASGRGSNLQAILDNIDSGSLDARVVVVISDNADAMALEKARRQSIPAVHIEPSDFASKVEYEKRVVAVLKEYRTDLVILAGYMRIVGRVLLDAYSQRILNIHPSLLPSFPGLEAQKQALEYGVKVSGCTVHFVDRGMDTGPIIIQAAVPVLEGDTVESLSTRILAEEHRIYSQAIQWYAEGRLRIEGRRVVIEKPR